MPFGHWRGLPLSEIPDDYLGWLTTISLRSRLRAAVTAEIERRAGPDTTARLLARPCPAPDTARELIGAGLRALARRHHPDAGGSHEEMIRVTAAADWLRERVMGAQR